MGKDPGWIPAFAGMTYREESDMNEIIPIAKWLFQQSLQRVSPKRWMHSIKLRLISQARLKDFAGVDQIGWVKSGFDGAEKFEGWCRDFNGQVGALGHADSVLARDGAVHFDSNLE